MSPTNRRLMIGSLAAAPMALAAGPDAVATPADTDLELVEAWNLWLAQMREAKGPLDSRTDEEWDALWDEIRATENRIAELPASGPTGLAVKMRLVLHNQFMGRLDDSNAFVLEGVVTPSVEGDAGGRLLWSAIQDAERLTGGRASA